MNPLAVELAKLALWLETVAADSPLTFLDHHLRRGNSLIGAKVANLGLLHDEFGMISREFITQFEDQLLALLNPLIAIRDASSDTTEQVKAKQKLLDVFERTREPFRALADLWTANVIDLRSELTSEHYQEAVAVVSKAKEFRKFEKETWFESTRTIASRPDVECFHWELEFPEVFFAEVGRRSTPGCNPPRN